MNHLFKSEILLILGNNIYKIRQQKNLTITALAKLARYGRGYLSKLEVGKQNVTLSRILNGKQNNPWIISLEKIAKGINKNIGDLLIRY